MASCQSGPFLGLDWFLLNLIAYSAVFIPLERLFARLPEQADLSPRLADRPGVLLRERAAGPGDDAPDDEAGDDVVCVGGFPDLQAWCRGQPFVVQFIGDPVPDRLRRSTGSIARSIACRCCGGFIAIHHSADDMDWLAGSRLHLVDVAVTRGLTYVPIYLLGFAEAPLFAYVAFVSVQATFIHANVRFEFGPLRWLMATPQFHHWHHGAEARPSTRTSRSICRCWIGCSAPSTCRRAMAGLVWAGRRKAVPSGYARSSSEPFVSK